MFRRLILQFGVLVALLSASPLLAAGAKSPKVASKPTAMQSKALHYSLVVPAGFAKRVEPAPKDARTDQIAESVLMLLPGGIVAMRLDVWRDGVTESAAAWFDRTHQFLLNPESKLETAQATPARVPAVRLKQAISAQAYGHELLFWVDGPLKFRLTWYDTADTPRRAAFEAIAATCTRGGR